MFGEKSVYSVYLLQTSSFVEFLLRGLEFNTPYEARVCYANITLEDTGRVTR